MSDQQESSSPEEIGSVPNAKRRERLLVIGALGFVLVVLVAAWAVDRSSSDAEPSDGALQAAFDKCAAEDEEDPDNPDSLANMLSLGDDGNTITVRPSSTGAGELVSYLALICVLGGADAPDSVIDPIASTTAMMGRQTAEWDDYSMTYSFASGSGLSATITAE